MRRDPLFHKLKDAMQAEVKAMLGLDLSEEPRVIREAKAEGLEEGREVEAIALITRQLTRRLGQAMPAFMQSFHFGLKPF